MKKLQLKTVTLVTVSSVWIQDTIDALMHNLKEIEFAAVKFITHERPQNLPDCVEFCQCEPILSLEDYSRFMIYELDRFIDTDHCLVIQRDGVVVYPGMWRDAFLEYDYIGAPWPEDEAFRNREGRIIRVGNGGFSLRSKRLLGIANKERIPFIARQQALHEDTFICALHRHVYEANDIRFADIDVAKYFAHEIAVPEIKGIKPFGFHRYRNGNRFYPRFPGRYRNLISRIFRR